MKMLSCSLLQSNSLGLGVVLVKFDHQLGPLVVSNYSNLENDLLMKLAIKGTSTLMNGLSYDALNTRRFRGLLQLSDDYFVYGYDLLLIDDYSDEGSFAPVMLFLVFPSHSVSIIGSNIKEIELELNKQTQNILNVSNLEEEFGIKILSGFQNMLL